MSPIGLVLAILLVVALALVITFSLLRQQFAAREKAARERFPNARMIIPGANFFGQESAGAMQGRGNGTFVLTDSEIYFERLLPRKEYHVPLAAVQSVETTNSFLGKTIFRPLLKVTYRNDAGQADAIAWYVPDLDGTKQAIEGAFHK